MLEGFEMLTEELDHPEGVAWDRAGTVYAGGEAGQIYAIAGEGLDRIVVANVGEWHLFIGEPGAPGRALRYPVLA